MTPLGTKETTSRYEMFVEGNDERCIQALLGLIGKCGNKSDVPVVSNELCIEIVTPSGESSVIHLEGVNEKHLNASKEKLQAVKLVLDNGEDGNTCADNQEGSQRSESLSSSNIQAAPEDFALGSAVKVVGTHPKHGGKEGTVQRHTTKFVIISTDGEEEFKISPKFLIESRPIKSSSNIAPSSPVDLEGLTKLSGDETKQISLFAALLAKGRIERAEKQVAELVNKLKCPVCHQCDEDTLDKMLVFARCGHRICRDCFEDYPRPVIHDSCGWRVRHLMRCHTCRKVVKKTTKRCGIMQIHW